MPIVSVVIPNYNHAQYLRQRIDSILNQIYSDFELIIVDDCSTDNSKEIIESYRTNPKVSQIIFNESNSGTPFQQWETGVDLAKGEWIWIAESDDFAENDFLEKLILQAEIFSTAGLIYSHIRWVDTFGKEIYCQELFQINHVS